MYPHCLQFARASHPKGHSSLGVGAGSLDGTLDAGSPILLLDDDGDNNTQNVTTARTMASSSSSYPTKLHPEVFWGSDFLQQHGDHVTLIDDSATTLAVVDKETNFQTILLSSSSSENGSSGSSFPSTLPQALAVALGWLSTTTTTTDDDNCYTFDDAEYLRAKNRVDENSIHAETWKRMIAELSKMLLREQPPQQLQQQPSSAATLQIVDVGAGLLSMLKLFLLGSDDIGDGKGRNPHQHKHHLHHPPHKQAESRLPSALATLQQNGIALEDVHYYAYEPNRALESPCIQVLQSLGFSLQVQTENDDDQLELVFVRRASSKSGSPSKDQQPQPRCTVYLRFWDFKEEPQLQVNSSEQPTPHLIVGCCFADLLEPYDLVSSLMRCFLSSWSQQQQQQQPSDLSQTTTLVYFPITFAGITQFLPPQPFEPSADCDDYGDDMGSSGGKNIPSDTTAFSLYSQCLSDVHGHNLDPHLLETAVRDYGGTCLGRGKSDWVIDPDAHHYLWRTLLYFFGSVAAPELHCAGWNAHGWLDRARQRRPTIQACNVDLLFCLPHLGAWSIIEAMNQRHSEKRWSSSSTTAMTYDEILFTAPRQVTTVQKNITETLAPDEIRIQTECSLISSGTELKIFTGSFDDAALDVNIQGMEEERMAYPLAYGYSLVGRVVECGTAVPNAEQLLGKRVFTFSAHATQVVTTRSAVQLVPDGCDALDAIFMPSVETALSLVQDARPLIGENVAVFGQGLIGLLVTAILGQQVVPSTSGRFGTITTFDTFRDRLAASAAMGATQALLPSESSRTLPFDVAIEVSGNGRALQTAIDKTRNGGRIVIGSWYGNKDVQLKLGIDFHRSHKTLKVSQVSEVSTDLRQTWSKERRFALTWELVKSIRPSRLLTRKTTLDHAQEAFESLEQGDEIAIAFEYNS